MRALQFTGPQIALVSAPPCLLLTTYLAFRYAAARLGPGRGYLAGFLFYWICWCCLLPLLTVGPEGLREMFQAPQPMFGRPNWLGAFLLVGPPLVMYLARFPAEVKGASSKIVVYSALFALANGAMEEILWRGAYITAFPANWLWAYLYPSIWFGLWHLAPQAIYPSEMPDGALAFAFTSSCWAWYGAGWQRQPIRSGGRSLPTSCSTSRDWPVVRSSVDMSSEAPSLRIRKSPHRRSLYVSQHISCQRSFSAGPRTWTDLLWQRRAWCSYPHCSHHRGKSERHLAKPLRHNQLWPSHVLGICTATNVA